MFNKITKTGILICALAILPGTVLADGHHEKPAFLSWLKGDNYIKVRAGIAQPFKIGGNSELDQGVATYVLGAAIGRDFTELLSGDIEYTYQGNSKAKSDDDDKGISVWNTKSNTLMANLNVNLTHPSTIVPYIKVGLGASYNKSSSYMYATSASTTYAGKTNLAFAWQAGMGFNFKFDDRISSELEYTYVDRGSVKTADSSVYAPNIGPAVTTAGGIDGNLINHVVTLGIKIKF